MMRMRIRRDRENCWKEQEDHGKMYLNLDVLEDGWFNAREAMLGVWDGCENFLLVFCR